MLEQATVGVIIPACNMADCLDRALCSLAMQTQPAEEVVVVDDGSQDATYAVAHRWRGVLPIKVIRHEHRCGIGAARATGIAALNTELVAQLDADDFVTPGHLATLRRTYLERPGLISPRPLHWYGGLKLSVDRTHDARPLPGVGHLDQLLMRNYVLVGALYSRRLYEDVGGYRDRNITYAEDWDLWLRMVNAGAQVAKPVEHTYVYRTGFPSYSNGLDWDVADIEVLDRFLAEIESLGGAVRDDTARYLRVAKFALLGRMGKGYLTRAASVTLDFAVAAMAEACLGNAGSLTAAAHDPDLGLLLLTRNPDNTENLLLLSSDQPGVLILARVQDDRMKVVEVLDKSLQVSYPVLQPVAADEKFDAVSRSIATGRPWENLFDDRTVS
ncbi:glycosyltransferase family 2 protein [Nocardia sp. NBC_00881]|uniref:glycosyltransferase family 2 protein n=1 Tax=Nocardia sp. NBC_00881 TaxID=2975995 RepID=UPI003865513F|nr:glycosyltransferase family 2 protein [Nocardia sp. NBC_00881]